LIPILAQARQNNENRHTIPRLQEYNDQRATKKILPVSVGKSLLLFLLLRADLKNVWGKDI